MVWEHIFESPVARDEAGEVSGGQSPRLCMEFGLHSKCSKQPGRVSVVSEGHFCRPE